MERVQTQLKEMNHPKLYIPRKNPIRRHQVKRRFHYDNQRIIKTERTLPISRPYSPNGK